MLFFFLSPFVNALANIHMANRNEGDKITMAWGYGRRIVVYVYAE